MKYICIRSCNADNVRNKEQRGPDFRAVNVSVCGTEGGAAMCRYVTHLSLLRQLVECLQCVTCLSGDCTDCAHPRGGGRV